MNRTIAICHLDRSAAEWRDQSPSSHLGPLLISPLRCATVEMTIAFYSITSRVVHGELVEGPLSFFHGSSVTLADLSTSLEKTITFYYARPEEVHEELVEGPLSCSVSATLLLSLKAKRELHK